MHPPLEVPSAPSRSSTDSTEMPRSRIADFNAAVLAPGSPDASPGSGNAWPSVCATSYLGIAIRPGRVTRRSAAAPDSARAPSAAWSLLGGHASAPLGTALKGLGIEGRPIVA
jgi:hypothetical protein